MLNSGRQKTVSRQRSGALDLSVLLGRGPSLEVAEAGEPEVNRLTFGILPLTDCAPIVVAHEKRFFEKHGIESSVAKFVSWTASRDGLLSGKAHAAHMLFGMPVAAAVGKLGTEHRPLVIPWILNRNGQAITVSVRHRELLAANARDLRGFAQERREKGRPMVFAMTLQPGTHAMWLRYWLAAGGIDPDNDVALITIPPPMMVANMRAGRLDGFCAGEPWNVRAVEEGLGFTRGAQRGNLAGSSREGPRLHRGVFGSPSEFREGNPQGAARGFASGATTRRIAMSWRPSWSHRHT